MKIDTRAVAGGFAGACVLTLLHEVQRKALANGPRLDVLGIRAIAKGFERAGSTPPDEHTLRASALAGDIGANTAYYSLVGLAPRRPVVTGGLLGLAAGLGAVFAPEPLGLGREPTRRTPQTSAITIALYSIAGLTAGAVYSLLTKDQWPAGEWGDAFFP
jgi:hypothetical protein